MNFQIIKKRKLWYIVSGALALFGVIGLLTGRLKLGIDFTGGSLMEIKTTGSINTAIDTSTGNSFANYINQNVSNDKTGNITVQKVKSCFEKVKFIIKNYKKLLYVDYFILQKN